MNQNKSNEWPAMVCPQDGTQLYYDGDNLKCPQDHLFRIINGIPRFTSKTSYADAFGEQWKRYGMIQLDSFTNTTITRDRLKRCVGERIWAKLQGKHLLECGCGAGRFTEVLLARGARVTSCDLSSAVDVNQENFPQNDHHRILQSDILNLPFEPKSFDVVLCLGVVQHTPSPEATLAKLFEYVRPGGSLVIDHYTHTISRYTKTAPIFRQFLKRLPPAKGIECTEWLVKVLLPMHKKVRKFRLMQRILSRISPVLCYYHTLPQLSDELQYTWALVDTHDSLTDWFKHYRTRKQIKFFLKKLGLEEIWSEYGGNGVEARGRRCLKS